MPEPEVTYSIEPVTNYAVVVNGRPIGPVYFGSSGAYNDACRWARMARDSRGYPPGDDRIQWPAIPAGVYVPPVPAPEAA